MLLATDGKLHCFELLLCYSRALLCCSSNVKNHVHFAEACVTYLHRFGVPAPASQRRVTIPTQSCTHHNGNTTMVVYFTNSVRTCISTIASRDPSARVVSIQKHYERKHHIPVLLVCES
jgi:hypothetical protein